MRSILTIITTFAIMALASNEAEAMRKIKVPNCYNNRGRSFRAG